MTVAVSKLRAALAAFVLVLSGICWTAAPAAADPIVCTQTARINGLSASTVLVAHAAGKTTYICGFSFGLNTAASGNAYLSWGTGTTCGTSNVVASPVLFSFTTPNTNANVSYGSAVGAIDQSPAAGTSDFCLTVATGPNVNGIVSYIQF